MNPQSFPATTWQAIALAALGAAMYAHGARAQNRAVRTTRRGPVSMRSLPRDGRWLGGLAFLGLGTGLHIGALAIAPLIVVQPVGALTVVFAVLLEARARRRAPDRSTTLATIACVGGIGLFVTVAGSAVIPRAGSDPAADAAWVVAVLAAVVVTAAVAAGIASRLGHRPGPLGWTTVAGTFFGCAAASTSIAAAPLAVDGFGAVPPTAFVCMIAAGLIGYWCVQRAHAAGPSDLVVAGLTVLDPLVAVGIGLLVLGEGAGLAAIPAAVMIGGGIVAAAGVVSLARRRDPDAPQPAEGGLTEAGTDRR